MKFSKASLKKIGTLAIVGTVATLAYLSYDKDSQGVIGNTFLAEE